VKACCSVFVLVLGVLCLVPFTSYADNIETNAEIASTEVEAEIVFDEEELVDGCTVTVYCDNSCGPLVACSGDSCTGGSDWVECDGVRSYCHYRDLACESDCRLDWMQCNIQCGPPPIEPEDDPCGCDYAFDACKYDCCFG
jgi:hypothetical protein